MKRADAQPFTEFMQAEAVRYARKITPHEIATWFENFPRTELQDFFTAWEMHKASDKGHYFPRIVDLQRLLKVIHDPARTDRLCAVLHSDKVQRCQYAATISVERRKAICRCHFRVFSMGRDVSESDRVVVESRTRPWDEVFKELAQVPNAPVAGGPRPRQSTDDIGSAIDEAIAFDEANRDDLMRRIAEHQRGAA